MSQQQSPWLETAYGWAYGENGWNAGMDSNLLKFSVLFDRNVDSIVASLPSAVNGQVHYNTSDNRLYFAVGTTYFSTPVPKWFEFKDRPTGNTYQYNGSSTSLIDSPSQLASRLGAVELTVSSLGTAAFEDVTAFATQAKLDVVQGQAQGYTDALRGDLADDTDPTEGAGLVGYNPSTKYAPGTIGERINIIVLDKTRSISHYLTKAELEDSRSGNPVLDTTNALNDALNDRVGTVLFEGGFKVSGQGSACLTMKVATSIIGVGSRSTFIRADSAGQYTNLLNMNITDNGGLLDCRDLRIENMMLFHNGGGMHVIENTAGMPIFNAIIRNCNMLAPVGARDLVATKFAFCLIENNTFGRGVTIGTPADPSADGNKLYDNLVGGETGIILQLLDGAYCTTVDGGTLVNRDCAIRVKDGSQIKIRNVQIEQQAAQSQSAERAHIVIEGVSRPCEGVRIENCNLGGGTNLDYLIYVNNANLTDITANTMGAPSVADLYLTGNAQYTMPRRDNIVKGTVANPRPASRFPMMVVDNGYGTYNTLRTQPALANGWLGGDFWKEENGDVVISTGFNAGTNTSGTVLATLPLGYRPADFYSLVAATGTTPAVIDASPNGELKLVHTGSNGAVGCQLRIPSKRG